MALVDDVKVALRVTSDSFDSEIESLIDAAEADMVRAGVSEDYVKDGTHPLAKAAITLYVKSHFGYDNYEAERFIRSYKETLASIMNSPSGMEDSASDDAS